ncbi:MAG: GNAT family protein [Dehalococcoidia bacterium]|nr:GNAT family protein [Dehalococcoidia bacterium]
MTPAVISESILQGQRVRLRPVQESDLPQYVAWLADREVTRWLAAMGTPPTLDDEYEWYERRRSDPDAVMWAIETLDGRLLGNVELRLNTAANRAEVGIGIHDRSQWSKGYGTDAMLLVVDYAFRELKLNRVELTTDERNGRAIRCYEKCGFVREGLLREHRLMDGKYGNTIFMSVLKKEWRARGRTAAA